MLLEYQGKADAANAIGNRISAEMDRLRDQQYAWQDKLDKLSEYSYALIKGGSQPVWKVAVNYNDTVLKDVLFDLEHILD